MLVISTENVNISASNMQDRMLVCKYTLDTSNHVYMPNLTCNIYMIIMMSYAASKHLVSKEKFKKNDNLHIKLTLTGFRLLSFSWRQLL